MTATLRFATPHDAPDIEAIYAPIVRETFISFEADPPSVAELRLRIEKTLEMFPWLVADDGGGRVIGYAYASRHRERLAYQWSVDVSCYMHPDARGQGIGKRLYTKLLAILAKQGFHAAFAGIALPNEASVRLHESVGFEPLGIYREVGYKLGAWRDTGWWQRRLNDPAANPRPPRALPSLGLRVLDGL